MDTNFRVLVVDDSSISRKATLLIFKHLNIMNVDIASNGSEAILSMKKRHYNLIMMDINMPILDGVEAAILIFDYYEMLDKTPPKIVALTSNAFSDELNNCLDVGMSDYLRKPATETSVEKMLLKNFPTFLDPA